jgi:hypothetical protein
MEKQFDVTELQETDLKNIAETGHSDNSHIENQKPIERGYILTELPPESELLF